MFMIIYSQAELFHDKIINQITQNLINQFSLNKFIKQKVNYYQEVKGEEQKLQGL